jgi:acetyltransferase
MDTHPLTPLFEPRTVAVIGVSADQEALGTRAYLHVRDGGFTGELFAVAGRDGPAPSAPHYRSLNELPRRAELVVIAELTKHVPPLLTHCAHHGARIALILSADYAERDLHAENLLREAIASLRHSPLRVAGPHCFGVMRASAHLNASLSRDIASAGSLALIAQSAGVCSAILDWSRSHNIGFSSVASLGAALDIGAGDVLDYFALDRETRAVLVYLERADHARRFMSGLRALARMKPVVVVKAGRSPHDPQACYGEPSFDDAVFDAALRRAGAVRVTSLIQLFSSAELLSHAPRVSGERLAVITNAAGLGVLAADRAFDLGLPLATLSDQTRLSLAALAPSRTPCNPLDLNADATAERYAKCLELCLADRGVDGVLVLLTPQLLTDPDAVAAMIAEREAKSHKPVLASFIGGPRVEAAREKLAACGVPTFESPEAAVVAFSQLTRYRHNRELLVQAPDVFKADLLDIDGARLIVEAALAQGRTTLSQLECKAVLSAFRVPVTAGVRTQDPNEALVAAQQIGFPVALKIDSHDIADKSEVNGVRLNLRSAAEVRTAHRELMADVARIKPDARVLGVTVEPMRERREDRELVAGIRRDATFGPVIALGSPAKQPGRGAPMAYALPPLNTRLATDLIEQAAKHGTLLELSRWPAALSGALIRVLLRLSDLACELPEVQELTIDPLLADQDAVVALDAHVRVKPVPASQRRYDHLAIAPYPRELVEEAQLADGTPIVIRPIRPEDAKLEQDLVRELSLETRRYRFMHALSSLTDEMLVRFTQLDYDRELGLIATSKTASGEVPLGVARYVGDGDELGCEFAIVVADAWQKRGVASQLMRALIAAARSGHFSHMHGDVLADNTRMLRWMERLGFSVSAHPEDPMLRVVSLPLQIRA